jgi:hypothetical protein
VTIRKAHWPIDPLLTLDSLVSRHPDVPSAAKARAL